MPYKKRSHLHRAPPPSNAHQRRQLIEQHIYFSRIDEANVRLAEEAANLLQATLFVCLTVYIACAPQFA